MLNPPLPVRTSVLLEMKKGRNEGGKVG